MDSAKTERDLGTYWAPEDRAWLWYNDTIETHALALRALGELDPAGSTDPDGNPEHEHPAQLIRRERRGGRGAGTPYGKLAGVLEHLVHDQRGAQYSAGLVHDIRLAPLPLSTYFFLLLPAMMLVLLVFRTMSLSRGDHFSRWQGIPLLAGYAIYVAMAIKFGVL